MSFENIQLPAFLIQDLYKDLLINDKNDDAITSEINTAPIPHLGNNKRNVAIIVKEKNIPFLADNDLGFLIGILGACKLSMADVALVNIIQAEEHTVTDITYQFNPSIFLLFGTDPGWLELPLNFPDFQVQQYNNKIYLNCPSLHVIANEKPLKKQLWESLQKIFF